MTPVTFLLNGRRLTAQSDSTILQVARDNDVDIPTLCEHKPLTPHAACRICLVQEQSEGRLLAACATTVAQDMDISTDSDAVLRHRRMTVRLMLASHSASCMVCGKGNRCELRRIASDLGIGTAGLYRMRQPALTLDDNPFISRDPSKCILCGKCIRICQEVVVEEALGYLERGFSTRLATFTDGPLHQSECTFCGACVSACPTGALTEAHPAYGGTGDRTVTTTCPYCGSGCTVDVQVKGDTVVRAVPSDPERPLCVRGSYGLDFIHSPDRLHRPHVRRNGKLQPVGWPEALSFLAGELQQTLDKWGPEAVGVLGSPRGTNEDNYLLQRFARSVLGTNNIDNGSRLYGAPVRQGLMATLGVPETNPDPDHLARSEVILVVGADLPNSAPQLAYAVRRAVKLHGARLILLDPARSRLDRFASLRLRPYFGTDGVLLKSLAEVICREELFDREFITRRTEGFEQFRQAVSDLAPEQANQVTGVPARHITQAARQFAGARQAAVIFGRGITQQPMPSEAVKALANLSMLAAAVWIPGGGIYAVELEANGRGACQMGMLPDMLPGYDRLDHRGIRRGFEEVWGGPIPAERGMAALQMIQAAAEGQLKALYVVGENPFRSYPDPQLVREALDNLQLLVVHDLFFSETASCASVLLPAASFAEKDGTFSSADGRLNRLSRIMEPPGQSLSDWSIILRLAEEMQHPLPFSSLKDIQAEIAEILPELEPLPPPEGSRGERPTAVGSRWPSTRGIARFCIPRLPEVATPSEGYPFTLVVRGSPWGQGTGQRTGRSRQLRTFCSRGVVEVPHRAAGRLHLSEGETVKVVSEHGSLAVQVKLSYSLPDSVVALMAHRKEAPPAALFAFEADPDTGTPLMKTCHVRLERVRHHER